MANVTIEGYAPTHHYDSRYRALNTNARKHGTDHTVARLQALALHSPHANVIRRDMKWLEADRTARHRHGPYGAHRRHTGGPNYFSNGERREKEKTYTPRERNYQRALAELRYAESDIKHVNDNLEQVLIARKRDHNPNDERSAAVIKILERAVRKQQSNHSHAVHKRNVARALVARLQARKNETERMEKIYREAKMTLHPLVIAEAIREFREMFLVLQVLRTRHVLAAGNTNNAKRLAIEMQGYQTKIHELQLLAQQQTPMLTL